MDKAILELPMQELDAVCRQHQVAELLLCGSALTDAFNSTSDVDFLVVFHNDDAGPWMHRFTDLQEALSKLFGREVDLVDKRGLEKSRNLIRKRAMLNGARVVYAAQ